MRRFFAFFSMTCAAAAIVAACDSSIDLGRGDDAGGSSSGDATSEFSLPTEAPTCQSTCLKAAACGYVEEGKMDACIASCPSQTTPDIRRCVQQARCEDLVGCAGIPEGGPDVIDPISAAQIEGCKDSCDHIEFFNCCSAKQHADCRALCETANASKRESFKSCGGSGSDCPKLQDCLEVFFAP